MFHEFFQELFSRFFLSLNSWKIKIIGAKQVFFLSLLVEKVRRFRIRDWWNYMMNSLHRSHLLANCISTNKAFDQGLLFVFFFLLRNVVTNGIHPSRVKISLAEWHTIAGPHPPSNTCKSVQHTACISFWISKRQAISTDNGFIFKKINKDFFSLDGNRNNPTYPLG